MKSSERQSRFRGWRSVILLALMLWIAVSCVRAFWLETYNIPSASMDPLLKTGDRILVDRHAFGASGPDRGDVVVFDGRGSLAPSGPSQVTFGTISLGVGQFLGLAGQDTVYVKRVIGVGGDLVSVDKAGVLRVNGAAVSEPYLFPGDSASAFPFTVKVPEGSLWLMGDHRSDSRDSRDLLGAPGGGMVPIDKVIGQPVARFWPLDQLGPLHSTSR